MPNDTITIYSDGGSRGNPGPAAIGAVLYSGKTKISEYGKFLGITTNNEAEYKALIMALKKVKAKKAKTVNCFLDSELVVRHLNHCYRLKNKKIIPLFIEVWNLMLDFKKITFTHIPRERNKEADTIVNRILNHETKQQKLI